MSAPAIHRTETTTPETAALDPPLPPETRMLLCTDGSTTRLLEALLSERLSLNLVEQHTMTAVGLPPRLRTVLACDGADSVVRRRSVLQTHAGRPVSRNLVTVVCRDPELTTILTDSRVPIGHGLAASHQFLGRTILATGWDTWRDDTDEPGGFHCVYKEYVLLDQASTAIAHIHERFNPALVPARCGVGEAQVQLQTTMPWPSAFGSLAP